MATNAKQTKNAKPAAKAGAKPATKPAKAKAERKAALNAADARKALPAAITGAEGRKLIDRYPAAKRVRPATNRASGATIALLDNREGAVQKGDDAPPWFVACVTHGVLVAAPTYRHAKHWRALSSVWCPECKKAKASAKRASAKPAAKPTTETPAETPAAA